VRADIGGDPNKPWVHIAWKYLWTAKDSWLGAEANLNLGDIGALYNLTMDPSERYDMIFNGAAPYRTVKVFYWVSGRFSIIHRRPIRRSVSTDGAPVCPRRS
jgi:hypothetical protein